MQVLTPDFRLGSDERLYALASAEPFWDFGSTIDGAFGSRFRFNIGIGKRFGKYLWTDLNYLFHKIRLTETNNKLEFDDHVLRLRFFLVSYRAACQNRTTRSIQLSAF